MTNFDIRELKKLYLPKKESHKGQNGKLMIIGGSHLFHGASLWALKVASRIVDMVFYSSIPENIKLTETLKSQIYDFIAIPRNKIENYIEEADVILLGPGLPREEGREPGDESTRKLTNKLLSKYQHKKWVIDAGSITEMNKDILLQLNGNALITPHKKEFEMLFGVKADENSAAKMVKKYNCTILLKGQKDIICAPFGCTEIEGGNEGMTKGGTGDVLAGLTAALYCKNEAFLSAASASFINKKAGDELYKRVGPFFNASDLCDEIPGVMRMYANIK